MDPELVVQEELDSSNLLHELVNRDLEILLSSILAHSSPEELSRIVKLVYQEQEARSTEYKILIHNSYGSFTFSDLGDKIMEMFNLDDEDRLRLERAVEAFNREYKPRFPINVRMLNLSSFLPFK